MFSFREASFKMMDFDTLRVMRAGTVVVAGGFCSFLLFTKDSENCLEVSEKSGNFLHFDEWQPCLWNYHKHSVISSSKHQIGCCFFFEILTLFST